MSISALLLPEFNEEMKRTRKTLESLPEGQGGFKAHERSSPLSKLAGHMAQLPSFVSLILTSPDVDISVSRPAPLVFGTKPQVLAAFEELADQALTVLKNTTDEVFEQHWKLSMKDHVIFSGATVRGVSHDWDKPPGSSPGAGGGLSTASGVSGAEYLWSLGRQSFLDSAFCQDGFA